MIYTLEGEVNGVLLYERIICFALRLVEVSIEAA